MNRIATTLTVALASLALPTGALAATGSGTVLSVDRSHHVVQVVDAAHVVHAYRFRQLGNVKAGSRIHFHVSGPNIAAATRVGSTATVSFYGKVVRSGARGLVLRLADGNSFTLGPKRLAHVHATASHVARRIWVARNTTAESAQLTVNIEGLQPGETVLVTESTDAQGNPSITLRLTATPSGGAVSEQQVSGVVTDLQNDTFAVTTADGSVLNLHMEQDPLANLNLNYCDQVTVSYHEDAGIFIADSVKDKGASNSDTCTGDSSSGNDQDAIGTITSVSGAAVTIDQGGGQGSLSFIVDDPTITDGFVVGDVVDVTYDQSSGASLDASDVEYVQNDATGVVTAVSAGMLTLTDDSTGSPDTFSADPTAGMFDGVAVGDEVDVSYHVSAGADVVDSVDDAGSGS